jgi:hypothetical protein
MSCGSAATSWWVASTATPFSSTSPKQVSTACQGGRQSIGGGFRIQASSGRPSRVAIRRAVRIEGGFVVNAHETVPTTASWHVIAFAVCANLGNVGSRLATYAIPASDTDAASVADVNSDYKQAFAQCPAGHFPIGGGAQVLGHTADTLPPGTSCSWVLAVPRRSRVVRRGGRGNRDPQDLASGAPGDLRGRPHAVSDSGRRPGVRSRGADSASSRYGLTVR